MGRMPRFAIYGLLLTGLALVGCQNTRSDKTLQQPWPKTGLMPTSPTNTGTGSTNNQLNQPGNQYTPTAGTQTLGKNSVPFPGSNTRNPGTFGGPSGNTAMSPTQQDARITTPHYNTTQNQPTTIQPVGSPGVVPGNGYLPEQPIAPSGYGNVNIQPPEPAFPTPSTSQRPYMGNPAQGGGMIQPTTFTSTQYQPSESVPTRYYTSTPTESRLNLPQPQ